MEHALLSASAAERWMVCTAAPRFEEQFAESTSEYAEEGRLAHSICELKVQKKFGAAITPRQFTDRLRKLKKDARYSEEMERTSNIYIDHLTEKAMGYATAPLVTAEVRVDFMEYVPDGFGTCDCVMIGGDTLDITDYKHGKGIPVSAEGNPQMRLYALGALAKYAPFYGGLIRQVRMTIIQPRISDEPTTETMTVDELKAWGESIKPIAQKAFSGFGEFVSGEHCRFCRGKVKCRTRAEAHTAFEDFKGIAFPTPENTAKAEQAAATGKPAPPLLTHAEIGDLLKRAKTLVKWYADLEEYALGAVLRGEDIPGWKVVAGTSRRKIADQLAAIAALTKAGYNEALLYKAREIINMTDLDTLVGGEKQLKTILGDLVQKPLGKPALVPLSDKREPYSSAAADFADVAKQK